MSKSQIYYHFKLHFQKADRRTGGKLLIHGTERRKDSCKAWNSPYNTSYSALFWFSWIIRFHQINVVDLHTLLQYQDNVPGALFTKMGWINFNPSMDK